MTASNTAERVLARPIIPDLLRNLVLLAGITVIVGATIGGAPPGFWTDAPRAWINDLQARRAVTLAQPWANPYIAVAAGCALLSCLWIYFARGVARWAGWIIALLPLLLLSITAGVAENVLAVLLFVATIRATGWLALWPMDLSTATWSERALLESGAGLGVVIAVMFAGGVFGLLKPGAIVGYLVLLACGTAVAWRLRRPRLRIDAQTIDPGTALILATILLLVQVSVPFVVAPEITYDAVYYHLTIVGDFVRTGFMAQLPNVFASTFPLLPHLAYTFVAALTGSLQSAKLVHFAVGLATIWAVFAVASRVSSDLRTGAFAALIWASTPLALWEISTAYVDMFAALLAILSLLAVLLWAETRRTRYALLCGIFCGLALGVKPNMALVCAPLYVVVFGLWTRKTGDILTWLSSGTLAGIVAAPWYIRAYILTGNPVFPFLNGIFQSDQWAPVNENFNFDQFGMGRSPLDFVMLPWRLTFHTSNFSEVPDGALGVLPLFIAAAPLLILVVRNRRIQAVCWWLLIAVAAWAVYAQYARYLLAVMPGAAIILGYLLGRVARSKQLVIRAAAYLGAVGIAAAAVPIFLTSFWDVPGYVPWSVDLGQISQKTYLEQAVRQYTAYEWMEKNIPDVTHAKILGVGFGAWPIAYSPAPIYISHMTYAGRQIAAAPDAARVLQQLENDDFKYVLIDYFPRPAEWRNSYIVAQNDFIRDNLQLVYANNYVYLYQVQQPRESTSMDVVTSDAMFAALQNGSADGWQPYGSAPLAKATSDCAGVTVNAGGGYLQRFTATPNVLYSFEGDMAPLSPITGSALLEVAWTRASHPEGMVSIEVEPLVPGEASYQMSSLAPDDAIEGTLYVASYDAQSVCVTRAFGTRSIRP